MKYKNKFLQITCDGGAATGKSTGAKLIAKRYRLSFLSSGLLYRYASYLIIKHKPRNQISFIKRKFKSLNYRKLNKLNLHSSKISAHSAEIAKILALRNILKRYQIKFINNNKGCVLEGRDASTKILPKSMLNFFICNLNIASRKIKELKRQSKNKIKRRQKSIILRNKKAVQEDFHL